MFKWLHECLYKLYNLQETEVTYVCDMCHKTVTDTIYIRMDILSYCCDECYTSMFSNKERVHE
jgi:hypothetical protein